MFPPPHTVSFLWHGDTEESGLEAEARVARKGCPPITATQEIGAPSKVVSTSPMEASKPWLDGKTFLSVQRCFLQMESSRFGDFFSDGYLGVNKQSSQALASSMVKQQPLQPSALRVKLSSTENMRGRWFCF